jgi:hypothetical protein
VAHLWITRPREAGLPYRECMRSAMGRLAILAASAALALASMVGCSTAAPPPPTSSPSTAAPVFASEEEALAAATEAYTAYQAMSSTVAQEGGADPGRMSAFAVGEALEAEIASFESLSKSGLRGTGSLAFDRLTVQSAELETGGVEAYLCLDVSGTDVIDTSGASTVPPDRPLRLPLQVSFAPGSDGPLLLIERSESWRGENFC